MQEIEALGASVCGVSVDGQERLAQFAAKYRLPFLLLSDRRGPVAARYGSLVNLGLLKFARRNTFLIDPGGRVARIHIGVNPAQNANDIVRDLRGIGRP
jgi:peroxiredoxin Q/BCP